MVKIRLLYFIKLTLLLFPLTSVAQHIELLPQDKSVSIRGLSVIDDKVTWISSSEGYVAITTNGGKSWNWLQVKGFEKSDFRDIEAFSAKEAVIMSSGTPAVVLKTIDGGKTWKVNYRKDDNTYFLDAMDFDSPKHGYIMGDPVDNHFLLLETKDGGNSWVAVDGPDAVKDQAAFAASGTCLRINDKPSIVTGGNAAELITTNGTTWQHHPLPILKPQASRGAFSFAFDKKRIIVVGGDYQNNKKTDSTACYSLNGGISWQLPTSFPSGYQSCVEKIDTDIFLSTGTSGSNISVDGGKNWMFLDAQSFNVCRKAKRGNLVILAGDEGKIGIFKIISL